MKDLTITSVIKVYEYDELNDADRALLDDAIEATRRSYAPYSHFSVGQQHCWPTGDSDRNQSGKRSLPVRTLRRTNYVVLCQFAVSGPGSEDSCHRRTYGKRLYRHSDSSLRRLSPGDSGNGKRYKQPIRILLYGKSVFTKYRVWDIYYPCHLTHQPWRIDYDKNLPDKTERYACIDHKLSYRKELAERKEFV